MMEYYVQNGENTKFIKVSYSCAIIENSVNNALLQSFMSYKYSTVIPKYPTLAWT